MSSRVQCRVVAALALLASASATQLGGLRVQSTTTTSGSRKAAAPGEEAAPRRPTLLLDIDGTLCSTDGIYQLAFKELLAPYGYEVDETWYKANVHGGVDAEVFKRLMPDDYSAEQLADVARQKDTLFCQKAREVGLPHIAGIGAALKMAKECGMRCIAVTNAPRPAAELVLAQLREECEAGDVIEDLVIGAECPQAKPHPDPYLIAMERIGAQPEDCVVFEDSRSGVRAGVAAAVAAVVGIRSELDDEALREAGATVTVADWTEVTHEMLDGLIKLRGGGGGGAAVGAGAAEEASTAEKLRGGATEWFPMVPEPIKYEGPDSTNPMAFRYYNKDEVILGRPMKDWLRFAVAYWHTWRGNGFDIFGRAPGPPAAAARPVSPSRPAPRPRAAATVRRDTHSLTRPAAPWSRRAQCRGRRRGRGTGWTWRRTSSASTCTSSSARSSASSSTASTTATCRPRARAARSSVQPRGSRRPRLATASEGS